ncbi:hypothetical protein ACS3YM_18150 [Nocardia sp. N13]|uniref:hypothetical protein n=1 Tax=Nocardioides sp. N13(2025) TaxID=3453405 RepID=UPI003F75C688
MSVVTRVGDHASRWPRVGQEPVTPERDQQHLAPDLDERQHRQRRACYGDSGGPNFLGTTDIVAATTITGDAVCRSTNVVYRLDTASARAFLADFVTLP